MTRFKIIAGVLCLIVGLIWVLQGANLMGGSFMTGQTRFVPYGATGYPSSTVDFDAYVVTTRTQTVPSTVASAYGANAYNNFDTNPAIMYTYTPDAPAAAQSKVML